MCVAGQLSVPHPPDRGHLVQAPTTCSNSSSIPCAWCSPTTVSWIPRLPPVGGSQRVVALEVPSADRSCHSPSSPSRRQQRQEVQLLHHGVRQVLFTCVMCKLGANRQAWAAPGGRARHGSPASAPPTQGLPVLHCRPDRQRPQRGVEQHRRLLQLPGVLWVSRAIGLFPQCHKTPPLKSPHWFNLSMVPTVPPPPARPAQLPWLRLLLARGR